MTLQISPIMFLVACFLLTAGCTMPSGISNQTTNVAENSIPAFTERYHQTLAQPEDSAALIKMDTDVYNSGEVVEFVIMNEKNHDLSCTNTPPSFSVRYQKGTGRWVTRMGEENPVSGNTTTLKPGESSVPYHFVTAGWTPGRYRIVSDCGVSREILLRALPSVTPTGTTCQPLENTSPYIRVNSLSDQYAGEPFTISGTTNLAAGEDLRYSIFAINPATANITAAKLVSSSTRISGGSCGTNTWSVDGVIKVPGEYFIGISDNTNTVSAVRRFSVSPEVRPTVTASLTIKTTVPGITTG